MIGTDIIKKVMIKKGMIDLVLVSTEYIGIQEQDIILMDMIREDK